MRSTSIARSTTREAHRRDHARHQLLTLARQRLLDSIVAQHAADGRLDDLVDRVARLDPHTAADQLIRE